MAGSVSMLVAAGFLFSSEFHHGPPPIQQVMNAPAGASLPPAGKPVDEASEPAPYAYDARTNRHWDPQHRHWHFGPPPSAAERAARAAGPTVELPEVTALAVPVRAGRDSGAKAPSNR